MNRRKFLYSSALGLFVPAAFGMPPVLRLRVVGQARRLANVPVSSSLKFEFGASDNTTRLFGYDTTTDRYSVAGEFETPAYTISVDYINIYLFRVGTSSIELSCVLHAGGASPGAEIAEANSVVLVSALPLTTAAAFKYYFTGLTLSASTSYWLAVWVNGLDATNYPNTRYQNTGTKKVYCSSTSRASPTWGISEDVSAEFKMQIYGT